MKTTVLVKGDGFTVYKKGGIYFVDTHSAFDQGFKTIQGVTEYLYYQGYIPTKEKSIGGTEKFLEWFSCSTTKLFVPKKFIDCSQFVNNIFIFICYNIDK